MRNFAEVTGWVNEFEVPVLYIYLSIYLFIYFSLPNLYGGSRLNLTRNFSTIHSISPAIRIPGRLFRSSSRRYTMVNYYLTRYRSVPRKIQVQRNISLIMRFSEICLSFSVAAGNKAGLEPIMNRPDGTLYIFVLLFEFDMGTERTWEPSRVFASFDILLPI